jgi:hypothetical protein
VSGALARIRDVFVEAPAPGASALERATPGQAPAVAILCRRAHERMDGLLAAERVAAAGVALALAQVAGSPIALAGSVSTTARPISLGSYPAARRAGAQLRGQGLPATAIGRLVWVSDRRVVRSSAAGEARLSSDLIAASHDTREVPAPMGGEWQPDQAALAAGASVELGRAALATVAPAALAIPFVRTTALDRVLAWFDGIVVVSPQDDAPMLDRALASLGALGRPVVAMAPLPRLAGMFAAAGLRAPAEALEAVTQLGLDRLEHPGG